MIPSTTEIRHLSCTSCSAPLYLYGNLQRSTTVICQHCGNVMDSSQSFRSLYAFTHIQQESKFRIGQRLHFYNVDFTIAGKIAYKSNESQWMQYQLYSALYGYAQLIEKNGRTLFLRKTYYLPNQNLWTLKRGDPFVVKEREFFVDSFHLAEVIDAQGNLTLDIQPQKRNKQCFAQYDEQVYLSVQHCNQVEYFMGEYV